MHSIIVDLEATCCDRNSIPKHAMEIIEIGAVAVRSEEGVPLSEFQAFVRPVRHPQLTAFCTQLTHIRQSDVDEARRFPEVVAQLRSWLTAFSPYEFCSWGDFDRQQMHQDCLFHHVGFPFAGPHRNLKLDFAAAQGKTKRVGVDGALQALGWTFIGTAHRGIDDARNIARIYRHLCGTR